MQKVFSLKVEVIEVQAMLLSTHHKSVRKVKQAGAELGQAQPELGLEDRVFMLWFEL